MPQKINAVLVGCGGISQAWLSAARDMRDLAIVGLVDLVEEAARARAEQFGLHDVVIGSDLKRVLDQAAPDVVFDCTIPEAHLNVTLTALAHGCHVLGEKPISDTLDHARQMIEAAQEAGKIYAVIQNRRYDPNIRRFRHFIETGNIGALTTLHSDFYLGAHFGGFRDRMRHVLLLDMAIHTFDAARLLTGADPVSVYCKEWNPSGSWYDHGASATAIFEMTGGLIYTYRGSWCAEGLNTTWEGEWRAIGERGSVIWDGAQQFRAEVVAKTGGFRSEMQEVTVPPLATEVSATGHAGVIHEFVRSVQTGATPETIATDNIKSLAMVFAAIESAESGMLVPVTW